MARPQEYNQSYTDKANSYLDTIGKNLPSIEGLAVFLEVHRSTIYDWKDKFPEFSDILEKILAVQADSLMNNGLNGKWNATISKLILTKHGYSDKQEITGADGKDLMPTPILGNLNVLSVNNSDSEDSKAIEANTSNTRGNISEQNHFDTADIDTSSPERQNSNADEHSI